MNLLLWGTTTVSNSYELVQLLQEYNFGSNEVLLLYDVTSLFTRVPILETLQIVENRLQELRNLPDDPISDVTSLSNAGIMRLLNHVLGQCYFVWESTLYKQSSGLPMGGRLSPILANLFLEHLEHEVLCSSVKVPRIFFRYVDDVFLVWDASNGSHKIFLDKLNTQHPEIQLTDELEQERSLPFLDIWVTRPNLPAGSSKKGKAEISIYRKPMHSACYVPYDSAHPHKVKKELVRGLFLCAHRLLAKYPQQREWELRFLKSTFAADNNGYPPFVLDCWFRQFHRDILRKLDLITVKTHLHYGEIFDAQGQQIFIRPTAETRLIHIPTQNEATNQVLPCQGPFGQPSDLHAVESLEAVEASDLAVLDTLPEEINVGEAADLATVHAEATLGLQSTKERCAEVAPVDGLLRLRPPVLLTPYVPGVSELLRKVANKFEVLSWYTYPGKAMDLFTRHRGRVHLSKTRNSVYCAICSCGCEYVGETNRNLKVHIREHLQPSSSSALTAHLKEQDHSAITKDTTILATESNNLHRD